MTASTFGFEYRGRVMRWYVESPRVRTIFYQERCLSLKFPWLVYTNRNVSDISFLLFGSFDSITPMSKVYDLYLPHSLGAGVFCMSGRNIESFWQSNFNHRVDYLDKADRQNRWHQRFPRIFRKPKLTSVPLFSGGYSLQRISEGFLGGKANIVDGNVK